MLRALTLIAFLVLAAPAAAVPTCPDAQPPRTVLRDLGSMESVIGGPDGRLYYTSQDDQALMRLDAPGAQPVVVASGIVKPGGLLVGADGTSIVVGYGDGIQEGAAGNLAGMAGLYRVDLETGAKTTLVTGTSMSNGLARGVGGDGSVIYASDDAGTGIDRIVGTRVERNFASVVSGNGLAVSADGRYLYVAQTFQPAAVKRVDLTRPSSVETYAAPGPEDSAAGLDGLTIDGDGRLFAAANQPGEVWRIGTDRAICAVARGLRQTSAVAFGSGGAFPATSLYAVGFDGAIVELPAARALPAPLAAARRPHLRVHVRPRFVRARRPTRVTIVVRRGRRLEPRAAVRLGHARVVRTNRRGRAHVRVSARRRGFLRLRVRAAGVPAFRGRVRVLRADPAPRPVALTD